MSLTRQQVEENGLISDEVLAEIPEVCECGSPIMFTDTVRQIFCSNPMCICKIAFRLEKMAKAMEVDGFGYSTCITLCKAYKMISPFQVFLLENRTDLETTGVAAVNKKIEAICNKEKRNVKLWEIVKLCGIPDIESSAAKIFSGYNTMEDAYSDIDRGQVPFIAERLGITNSESSVLAVRIYNNLIQYKGELFFGETQFNVITEEGQSIKMAITGSVYGYKNKGAFVKELNNRYSGKINFMLMSSVSSDIDILVCDADSNSSKFINATKINRKYMEKLIESGEIGADTIGSLAEGSLHRIGEKIIIADHYSIMDRLDKYAEYI